MRVVLGACLLVATAGCESSVAVQPACSPFVLGNTVPIDDAGPDGAPPCPENPLATDAGVYASGFECLPYCAMGVGAAALGCRLLPVCGGKHAVRGAVCVGCE